MLNTDRDCQWFLFYTDDASYVQAPLPNQKKKKKEKRKEKKKTN